MPLLRSSGAEYHRILCELIAEKLGRALGASYYFETYPDLMMLQTALTSLSETLKKRIVLMFDDAAHLGREASLGEFFDVFRTLSSSSVSCKATIYPGVTNFGTRFDVFNDATVVDVIRDEDQEGFSKLFADVLSARFPEIANRRFSSELSLEDFAAFVGKSVLGNMRSFIYACNSVAESTDTSIGLPTITKSFLELTTNFYWPLLDEVKPKLGKYTPVVDVSTSVAEAIFEECGREKSPFVIVHRDIIARLSKAFEILEYVGFCSKREASKALKSGGRGSRYALNLCLLLEKVPGSRLTGELFEEWRTRPREPVQIHSKGTLLSDVHLPSLSEEETDLEIFGEQVDTLRKSGIYPYGLTDTMINKLKGAGIMTVGDLYSASEEELDSLYYVGESRVKHLKNIVSQAIWL